jgi:hypothetical protein
VRDPWHHPGSRVIFRFSQEAPVKKSLSLPVKIIAGFGLLLSVAVSGLGCAATVPPPPPERVVVVPARPHPAAIWVNGHWAWKRWRHEYVWVPGHWKYRRGNRWIVVY